MKNEQTMTFDDALEAMRMSATIMEGLIGLNGGYAATFAGEVKAAHEQQLAELTEKCNERVKAAQHENEKLRAALRDTFSYLADINFRVKCSGSDLDRILVNAAVVLGVGGAHR